jgi:hypothetical protein
MPSFSLLKRIGREFSNSQQSRQEKQQHQQPQEPEAAPTVQNGGAKSPPPRPRLATTNILNGSAVTDDSDLDSCGINDGSSSNTGPGKARKERRNSKRDLLLRMMGKPPLTPLRGRAQSQPAATPQRSTTGTTGVSQRHVSFLAIS